MSHNMLKAILESNMSDMPRHVIHIVAPREPGSHKSRAFVRIALAEEVLRECHILVCHLRPGTTIALNVFGPEYGAWTYTVTGRETTTGSW